MRFSLTMSNVRRNRQFVSLLIVLIQFFVYSNSADALDEYGSLIYKNLPAATEADAGVIQTTDAFMNAGRFQRAISILKKNENLYRDQHMFLAVLICTYATWNAGALIRTCDEWFAHGGSSDKSFNSIVYEFQALGYVRQQDYKSAVDAFNKSIQIDARERVIKSRTAVEGEIVKQDAARKDDEKSVIAKTPYSRIDMPLRSILDLNLWQQADLPAIETLLEEGFANSSASTKALVSQAEQLEDIGQFEKARDVYRKASTSKDFNAIMWNQYGLCSLTVLKNAKEEDTSLAASLDTEEKIRQAICTPFEKAVTMNDSDWRLWSNFGLAEYLIRESKTGWKSRESHISWKDAFEKALSSHETPVAQRLAIEHVFAMERGMEALQKFYSK